MSGEQSGNAEQGTRSDAVLLPTKVVRLADLQETLQAMVTRPSVTVPYHNLLLLTAVVGG